MLPKKRRVGKDVFNKITTSRSFPLSFATLKIIPINGLTKASFVVSKKVAKTAVLRNTLRRKGYSILEKNIKNIKDGFALIFYIKGNFTDLPLNKALTECKDAFKRIGII